MIVYFIRNSMNGRWYVGKTVKTALRRWTEHKRAAKSGSKSALSNAIRLYGPNQFSVEILCECENAIDMDFSEIFAIALLHSIESSVSYNMTEGGDGGSAELMRAYWASLNQEERKIRISKSMSGILNYQNDDAFASLRRQNALQANAALQQLTTPQFRKQRSHLAGSAVAKSMSIKQKKDRSSKGVAARRGK